MRCQLIKWVVDKFRVFCWGITLVLSTTKTHQNNTKDDGKWKRKKKGMSTKNYKMTTSDNMGVKNNMLETPRVLS